MFGRRRAGGIGWASLAGVLWVLAGAASAQVLAPKVDTADIPPNVDVFNLSFEQVKTYSSIRNLELIGHSYFKIPERTAWAKGFGRPGGEVGAGFNTVRVYDGIAYLAGHTSPATLYAVVIADVRDPRNIKVLSTIPCNPGPAATICASTGKENSSSLRTTTMRARQP